MKSGETRKTLKHAEGLVFAAGIAADGRTVASCGGYALLNFWELPSGRERASPKGVEGPVFHVAFSPDGRTLVAGGAFRLVQLWEVSSGRERAALDGPGVKTAALAFCGDGRWLAAGAEDGRIHGWELIPATPTARLSVEALQALWNDMGGEAGAPAYRAHPTPPPDRPGRDLAQGTRQTHHRGEAERIARLLKDPMRPVQHPAAGGTGTRTAGGASGPRACAREEAAAVTGVRRIERLVQKLDGKMLPLEQLAGNPGSRCWNVRTRERDFAGAIAAGAPGGLLARPKASPPDPR